MFKKQILFVALMVASVVMTLPRQSSAFGIGVYVPVLGTGTAIFNGISDNTFGINYGEGYGIVLDTRVARNALFSYRLNVGYANGTLTHVDYPDTKADGWIFCVLDNSFGFGVVKTSFLRLWVGPQVRYALLTVSDTNEDSTITLNLFGLGLAPVIGANFNIGRLYTVGLDLGYRFSFYGGIVEDDNPDDPFTLPFTMTEQMFFINLSVLFRIRDVFERSSDTKEYKPDYNEEYY